METIGKKRIGWSVKIWEVGRREDIPVKTCYMSETIDRESVEKHFGCHQPDVEKFEIEEIYEGEEPWREESRQMDDALKNIQSSQTNQGNKSSMLNTFEGGKARMMMANIFQIPPKKAGELSRLMTAENVVPLIEQMWIWKADIDAGKLGCENVSEVMYERISKFLKSNKNKAMDFDGNWRDNSDFEPNRMARGI